MKKFVFKNEGDSDGQIIGPLWIERNGKVTNYKDSKFAKPNGGFFAEWFTLSDARKIAKLEGLELEE